MTVKEGLAKTKEGLPKEAFAIIGDPEDPETWSFPIIRRASLELSRGSLILRRRLIGIGCQRLWLLFLQVVTGGRGLMAARRKYFRQLST